MSAMATRGGPTGKIPGYQTGQISNFTPEMMELFRSLFSQVSPDSYTGRLAAGDQSLFEEMEAPAMRQFAGFQGDLASRFSAGMGGQGKGALGARHSSGFQNTANQAASNFAQGLQSQRQGLQRQAIQDLMGMSQGLLGQRPFENFIMPKKKGFLEELFGNLSSGFGEGLGQGAGGLPYGNWIKKFLGMFGGG